MYYYTTVVPAELRWLCEVDILHWAVRLRCLIDLERHVRGETRILITSQVKCSYKLTCIPPNFTSTSTSIHYLIAIFPSWVSAIISLSSLHYYWLQFMPVRKIFTPQTLTIDIPSTLVAEFAMACTKDMLTAHHSKKTCFLRGSTNLITDCEFKNIVKLRSKFNARVMAGFNVKSIDWFRNQNDASSKASCLSQIAQPVNWCFYGKRFIIIHYVNWHLRRSYLIIPYREEDSL